MLTCIRSKRQRDAAEYALRTNSVIMHKALY